MKILPTLDGGLCILPESKSDWLELELIVSDGGSPEHLAQSLGDLMDDDGDWDEYVVPDLKQSFSEQIRFVSKMIEKAQESQQDAVFISAKEADPWYGAINQARLTLQSRYQLDEIEDVFAAKPELRSAFFRDRFYLFLQSMLLDYVMAPDQT